MTFSDGVHDHIGLLAQYRVGNGRVVDPYSSPTGIYNGELICTLMNINETALI